MGEDRFDDMMRDAAQSYNAPPPTPREEMWQHISQARERARDSASIVAPVRLRRLPWWMGMAAALLLGVALGRTALQPGTAPERSDTTAAALLAGDRTQGETVGELPAAAPVDPGAMGATPETRRSTAGASAPADGGERRVAARTEPQPPPANATDVGALYRMAAMETLGQAEALLTVFRAEERPEARARVSAWARDVLTGTRLLLDSPAAEDPQLAALLQDLELVLAQITALGNGESGDRELIDDAIRQRDVMPRLRTIVPAGLPTAGA